jgi:hypothetical protein
MGFSFSHWTGGVPVGELHINTFLASGQNGRVLVKIFAMDKIFGKMFSFGEKKPKGETPYEGVESYTYFDHAAERHDIYEFCKELTEYLAKNKVRNIMFIDRGARGAWVGVHEYWKRHYPDREMPNLYFVNPDVVSDNLQQQIEAYSFITAIAGVEADVVSQLRPGDTKDAQDKFSDTYTRLDACNCGYETVRFNLLLQVVAHDVRIYEVEVRHLPIRIVPFPILMHTHPSSARTAVYEHNVPHLIFCEVFSELFAEFVDVVAFGSVVEIRI